MSVHFHYTQGELLSTLRRQAVPPAWRADEPPSLDGVSEVAVDFETTGLRWYGGDRPVGLAVAWSSGGGEIQSCYLPFGHSGGNLDEEVVRRWARTELRGKRIVNLNLKFDAHFAREWGVDLADLGCTFGDVAHYAALLDDHRAEGWRRSETPFSLEAVGLDYAGEGKLKGALDPARMKDYHASEVTEYARQDARLVIKVMEAQRPLLARDGLERVQRLEDSVLPVVVEMERNAALIDVEKLHRWDKQSALALGVLRLRLANQVGWAVNPDKPEHMARLFRERGLESDSFTDTGRQSFDAKVLQAHALHPDISLVIQVSRLADLRSKFIIPYSEAVGSDGLLRFELHQLKGDQYGTVSGRFSSSKPQGAKKGANVQQVFAVDKQLQGHCVVCPSKVSYAAHKSEDHPECYVVRELFIPEAGKIMYDADADQVEYRIFAGMTNSHKILDVYAANPAADFHQTVCGIVQEYQPGFSRTSAKGLNFTLLFGGGAKKTAEVLGVDEATGEAMRETYFRVFPEAHRLMQLAMETAASRGYVKTHLGRRSRFPRAERTHKALNAAIQGTAADINKLKLVELYAERKRLGLTMRLTVHDEIVLDLAHFDAAAGVDAILNEQTTPTRVPITWHSNTGPNWAACK